MKLTHLKNVLPEKIHNSLSVSKKIWSVWAIFVVLFVVVHRFGVMPTSILTMNSTESTSQTSWRKNHTINRLGENKFIINHTDSSTKYVAQIKEEKITIRPFSGPASEQISYRIKMKDSGFALYKNDEFISRFKEVDGKINVYGKDNNRLFKVKFKKGYVRHYNGDSTTFTKLGFEDIYEASIDYAPFEEAYVKAFIYFYRNTLF